MAVEPSFRVTVAQEAHVRLDAYVALHIPGMTRAQARRLILEGKIRVNGASKRPAYPVKKGDCVTGRRPVRAPSRPLPESRNLDILYQDEALVVLNKPAGLVVHPAPGHASGTLVNALLFRYPELHDMGDPMRPGIVHRLDKDTSGLLVVARRPDAYVALIRQFKSRRVVKSYLALVYGRVELEEGWISLPIGRHPKDRKRMATTSPKGRAAHTQWRVRERFDQATLLEIDLKTGRTHQIRVHCAAMGCPVVGDALYGKRKARKRPGRRKPGALETVKRQMLHARSLRFVHPVSLKPLEFEAPLPGDMQDLMVSLREAEGAGKARA